MRKVSTPGDRAYLLEWIPVVMTATVVHIFKYYTVDIIMALGPFNKALPHLVQKPSVGQVGRHGLHQKPLSPAGGVLVSKNE